MGKWDDYQGYDPDGESIEELIKKLQAQQKMIASTIVDTEGNTSKITQNSKEISLRVTKETYDTDINDATDGLKTRVTLAESSITQNADEIALRVTKDVYNTDINDATSGLKARVSSAESSITQNAEEIALRVAKTVYDTDLFDATTGLSPRLSTAESNITQNADEISLRVTKTTYDTDLFDATTGLSPRLSTAESNITQNADAIALRVTKTTYDNDINDATTGLKKRMNDAELKITDSAIVSTVRSSTEYVSDLASKTDDSTTDALTTRVSSAESNIAQNADAIALRVTTSTYNTDINDTTNGLKKRMSDAELKITDSAIVSTVRSSTEYTTDLSGKTDTSTTDALTTRITNAESSITQNADNINLKVSKDSIVSEINQSAETIKIAASKLNLVGYVTVTDLETEGSTIINGSNVTTGTMSADRIRGGELKLGGSNNVNGRLQVVDSDGNVIADLNGKVGGFDDLTVGGTLTSPSVQNVNNDSYHLYVDPINGDDSKTGRDWTNAKKKIQSAINSIPKTNHGNITIWVHYDNGREIRESEVNFYGFTGSGKITLDFQTTLNELNGTMDFKGCTNFIHIKYGTINSNGNRYPVKIEHCTHVDLGSTIVYAHSTNTVGIMILNGANAYLSNVESYKATNDAIQVTLGARMTYWNCKGLGGSYGLYVSKGALVSGTGTTPGGNTETYSVTYGGQLFTTPTADYGTEPNPTPPDQTKTWTNTSSKSWRDNWGWRTDNSYIYQGEWDNYGHHRGFAYFGTNISSEVTGKSIKQIRIYAKRRSKGGSSLPQDAYFGWHGDASQPSGTPNVPNERVAVAFKWGDEFWFDAPSSWYDNFASGAAKGIGIYTTSTSNTDYMIFEPTIKVEITYA